MKKKTNMKQQNKSNERRYKEQIKWINTDISWKKFKGEKKHYIHRKFNSSPNIYGYLFYIMSNVYVYKCLPSECGFYWICGLVGW